MPGAPEAAFAEHGIPIPQFAGEAWGAGPGGGVLVEAGGDAAEGVEPGDEGFVGGGFLALEELEGDGVAGGAAGGGGQRGDGVA